MVPPQSTSIHWRLHSVILKTVNNHKILIKPSRNLIRMNDLSSLLGNLSPSFRTSSTQRFSIFTKSITNAETWKRNYPINTNFILKAYANVRRQQLLRRKARPTVLHRTSSSLDPPSFITLFSILRFSSCAKVKSVFV